MLGISAKYNPECHVNSSNLDAPNVKIIPPLVYLAGLMLGSVVSVWIPTKIAPRPAAWTIGALLIFVGAGLAGSAIIKFKLTGTTVRPDRRSNSLVVEGPYKITRNPMYLGLALVYLGIGVAEQSIWALILLPVVLLIIQRKAIEPEEAFLRHRFGAEYISYMSVVRRWL
jgi:protein-S-isoprenylcysteine O-methyltransferase Ste14